MSHRTPIFYVDLVVRSGLTLEQAIVEARTKDEQRKDSGFDQAALDEAAWRGFANGAFEELEEDVPAVVEEFFPDTPAVCPEPTTAKKTSGQLGDRLQDKVARMGTG